MKSPYWITAVALAGFCLTGAAQNVLVDDLFNDFDRIGGFDGSSTSSTEPAINTPTMGNTQWVVNGTSQMVASASGLAWNMNNTSNRMAIGYFPNVTVGSNPVTFRLDFTTGAFGLNPNNLRIALVNATPGGLRTTDGFGSTDDSYIGDVGYGLLSDGSNIGGGQTAIPLALNLKKRAVTTSNNLLGSAGDWGSTIDGTAGTGYLDENTAYSLALTLQESGGQLLISMEMTGGNLANMSLSGSDATDPVFDFNAIALRWGQGELQFSDFNFTRLTVSEVPEPSVFALVTGLVIMGFAAWRRRR